MQLMVKKLKTIIIFKGGLLLFVMRLCHLIHNAQLFPVSTCRACNIIIYSSFPLGQDVQLYFQ